MNAQLDPDAGIFQRAKKVNDSGDILGGAWNLDTNTSVAYVIDASDGPDNVFNPDPATWLVTVLPNPLNVHTSGVDMNEWGDVVVKSVDLATGPLSIYLYNPWCDTPGDELDLEVERPDSAALNNTFQVAVKSKVDFGDDVMFDHIVIVIDYSDPNALTKTIFAEESYSSSSDLNDSGHFCGSFTLRKGGVAYRHDGQQLDPITNGSAAAINSDGDVLIAKAAKGNAFDTIHVLHTGGHLNVQDEQLINIDDLVDDNNP